MEKEFIITVFLENKVGLLSQITTVFTHRNVNIESLTASESAVEGVHKFTIIVKNDVIISTGYNGFPRGCSDDIFPWNRNEADGETKYPFVVHAELNAILNTRGKSLVGSRVYVGLFPCHECAKAIIQAGIKEVIYLSDKYKNTPSDANSRRMLSAAGVKLTKLATERKTIVLKFDADNA